MPPSTNWPKPRPGSPMTSRSSTQAGRRRRGGFASSSIYSPNSSQTMATTAGERPQPSTKSEMPRHAQAARRNISVQLTLRHRRFEPRDLGGLRRLAVEGQHVAFARDHDMIAVGDFAGEDHFGHGVMQMALDHPLQRARAIGGIP